MVCESDMRKYLKKTENKNSATGKGGGSSEKIYELEGVVKLLKDDEILDQWSKLLTSDHFYYMCTKYWADGDVHKYFSPYESPYEAYIYFMNAMTDLENRITNEIENNYKEAVLLTTKMA